MSNTVDMPQIILKPIEHLVPYARNARTHSDEQLAQIAASFCEFGWTNAVLADDHGIVAGHGRVLAAQRLYAAGKTIRFPNGADIPVGFVPVVDCTGWSPAQRRAYILADNKLALNAGWDVELLQVEINDLQAEGFDIGVTGFSPDELAAMFADLEPAPAEDRDPDAVPDVPEVPFSKLGDMWVCGPHRVRCGSSLLIDDWDALMQGELADLQACDPPYNVAYESELAGSIKNDSMSKADFEKFLYDFYTCSFGVMKAGAAMYVAHSDSEGIAFREQFIRAGFKLSSCLTWKKNALVLGRMDYQPISEPILYGWKPGAPHKWFGGRKKVTVHEVGNYAPFERMDDGRYAIRYGDRVLVVSAEAAMEEMETSMIYHEKPKRSALHPTMKPVALWERLIRNSARPQDIVIDGFGGSGTTMMAAERCGMVARLMELDPRFVDAICVRYFMLTGRVPVHAVTGEPFPREVIDRLSPKCND